MSGHPNLPATKKSLERAFGKDRAKQFDDGVIESLLEMFGGDSKEVVNFLTADASDPAPFEPTEDGVPKDYFKKPQGVDKFKNLATSSRKAPKHELRFKSLFLQESSFPEHLTAQRESYPMYVSVLLLLLKQRVDIPSSTKGRVLAGCLARRDHELTQYILGREEFGLPEVLRAVTLLDTPRRIRALRAKHAYLSKGRKAKAATLGAIMSDINSLETELCVVEADSTVKVSLSGALCKRLRAWVKSIPPLTLTFYALSLPKEPWKELADYLHLKPSDFQVPWFQAVIFGEDPPPGSVLARCASLTVENMLETCRACEIPYAYLKRTFGADALPTEVKAEVARYEKLRTIIWWYEDLACPEVDAKVEERLRAGEKPDLSYGKLMERLMVFSARQASFYPLLIPIAEERMRSIRLPMEKPVVVLGDASYSMDVAIRCSAIISGVLCYLTDADLKFFNGECFDAEVVPRSVPEIMKVATETRADGLTAPAACMWRYYSRKEEVKVFVVVTDEIENIPYHDHYFAQLFYKYYNEVYPAKLVFVSFLERSEEKGRMVQALEAFGIVPLQFRLDQTRPDLTKLDALIGTMSAETDFFATQTSSMAEAIQAKGLSTTVRDITAAPPVPTESEGKAPAADASAREAECIICCDRKKDTALLECGHVVACSECAPSLKDCPLCRKPVVRFVRIYT